MSGLRDMQGLPLRVEDRVVFAAKEDGFASLRLGHVISLAEDRGAIQVFYNTAGKRRFHRMWRVAGSVAKVPKETPECTDPSWLPVPASPDRS